ncbi:hypothetical protein BLA29_009737, partial [Euroglyphus maynei]
MILNLNDMYRMIIDYKQKVQISSSKSLKQRINDETMLQFEQRFRQQSQIPLELTFKQFYDHVQNGRLFRLLFNQNDDDNLINIEEYFDKIIRLNLEINDLMLPLWRPLTSTTQWLSLQTSTQSTLQNEIHVLANDIVNRLTKIGSFLFDSYNDNEIVNVDQLTLLEN